MDQSLPIATIRCMYYNCDDDNDSLCLEYEGSNWNEDYDFSAMAKSQRGSGREREGWLIVTLIVFSYVFLTCGCLWNKPVDFLTSNNTQTPSRQNKIVHKKYFLLCVFYIWSYFENPVKFSISRTANLSVDNFISFKFGLISSLSPFSFFHTTLITRNGLGQISPQDSK